MSQEAITRELIAMLRSGITTDEEMAACLERRVEDRERRIVAERDGWRAIARELLAIAFDGDLGADGIPPLEVTELRSTGRLPARSVPALAQFWADLTAKHADKRQQRRVLKLPRSTDPRTAELLLELFEQLQKGTARVQNVTRQISDDGSVENELSIRQLESRSTYRTRRR